ncbi:MAG: hypothetical protein QG579_259 [Patescibacteria group bacterium]|nr:hypothetical protein [Patescibacteria group bacterium]
MNNQFLKLFFSVTFLLTGFLFLNVEKVNAACVVSSATFRPTQGGQVMGQIPPTGWYTDTTPPYVYIDFVTTGCSTAPDNTFNLSIVQTGDNQIASGDPDVENFTERQIDVPSQDNFTIAARAGDDKCDSEFINSNPRECTFYIRINDNQAVLDNVYNINQIQTLQYDCHNGCDNKNWEWLGLLTEYQGIHPDDIPQTNTGDPSGGGPGIAGQNWDINIQNPIGGSDMTIVDFIQKVIDFALTVGIPIIAIAIIYAGLLFVTARGNDKQLETAKNAFTYAVIGGAILLGSFIFAKLIKDTIETIAMINIYFG